MKRSDQQSDGYAPAHVYRYTHLLAVTLRWARMIPEDPEAVDTPGTENPACPTPCVGDFNASGAVDVDDLLAFIWCVGNQRLILRR